jgi:hypothetical protein
MIQITTCPKCKSGIEITECKEDAIDSVGVFCVNEECFFHRSAIVGLDRTEPSVYIAEELKVNF